MSTEVVRPRSRSSPSRGDPERTLGRRLRGVTEPLPELATTDPDAYFVTRAFEAWNQHGPSGAAAWLSPWVELVDPPDWPGSSTWRGRDAALGRLDEVAGQLGGAHVVVAGAHSVAREQVDLTFEVRDADVNTASVVGAFSMRITVDQQQIVRAVVSVSA